MNNEVLWVATKCDRYKSPVNILFFIHQKETSLYSLSKSQDLVNLIGDISETN